MRARFNIRQRVNNDSAAVLVPFVSEPSQPVESAAMPIPIPIPIQACSDEMISKYLSYIRRGDRSKFSTTFLDRHFAVISGRHPIRRHVLEEPETLGETLRVATKLLGSDYATELVHHMESLSTFTFMEYAVWLGKYSIVSGMLHGGVNPCLRGDVVGFRPGSLGGAEKQQELHVLVLQQRQQLAAIGSNVLKRFFDSFPLRLSTYIVKRVVRMRMIRSNDSLLDDDTTEENHEWNSQDLGPNQNDSNGNSKAERLHTYQDDSSFRCPVCCEQVTVQLKLQFDRRPDTTSNCDHVFCESCFWNDLLSHIDSPEKRGAKDVVSCLSCGKTGNCEDYSLHPNGSSSSSSFKTRFLHDDISHLGPAEKCELSLERFHRLPANQRELKSKSSKKKKLSEADHLASNWLDAVFPSLGSTRDVRRDKFMVHIERNAITYVRGCLLAGVDVQQVNEYGQSAVYVAAWRGYDELVELLLEHGADAELPANGGSTIRSLCSGSPRPSHRRVLELIDSFYSSSSSSSSSLSSTSTETTRTHGTTTTSTNTDDKPDADSPRPKCWLRNNASTPSVLDDALVRNELGYSTLIPASSDHPGAGSCVIDDAISPAAIDALLALFRTLPFDRNQKQKKNSRPCSDRSYFCDTEGVLRRLLGAVVVRSGLRATAEPIEAINDAFDDDDDDDDKTKKNTDDTLSPPRSVVRVFPHMRFLQYSRVGAVLPPHIDLRRVNPFCPPSDQHHPRYRSTHTFLLYLNDCTAGGETRLLEEVTADGSSLALATVSPRRGRLLVFPHVTPHEGMEVIDVPKILLRGELQLTNERIDRRSPNCC